MRPPQTLISAIEKVSAGELWVDDLWIASICGKKGESIVEPTAKGAKEPPDVTRRELDIVRLIGRGYRNKKIAAILGISEATVRHHLTVIFGKLSVSDRLELLIYAHRNNLVDFALDRYGRRSFQE